MAIHFTSFNAGRNDAYRLPQKGDINSLLVMALQRNDPLELEALLKRKLPWNIKPIMLTTRNLQLLRILFNHCYIGQRVEEIVIENYGYWKVKELILNNELNPFEKLFPDETEEAITKRVFKALGLSFDYALLIWFENTFERIRQGMQDEAIKSHFLLTILNSPKTLNHFNFFYSVLRKMGRLSPNAPQLIEIKDAALQNGMQYIALIYTMLTPEPISALLKQVVDKGLQSLHDEALKILNTCQGLTLLQAKIELEIMRREVGRSSLNPENLPKSVIKVMQSNPGNLRILSYKQLESVLIHACREGNQRITSWILDWHKSMISTKANHFGVKGTLLSLAAASGNAGLVSQLMQEGLSLSKDPQILYTAVIHNKLKLIQWLGKKSKFWTEKEIYENSLIAAERMGSLKILEALLLFNVKTSHTRAEIVIAKLESKTVKRLISTNKIDLFEKRLPEEPDEAALNRLIEALEQKGDMDLLNWFKAHFT